VPINYIEYYNYSVL